MRLLGKEARGLRALAIATRANGLAGREPLGLAARDPDPPVDRLNESRCTGDAARAFDAGRPTPGPPGCRSVPRCSEGVALDAKLFDEPSVPAAGDDKEDTGVLAKETGKERWGGSPEPDSTACDDEVRATIG